MIIRKATGADEITWIDRALFEPMRKITIPGTTHSIGLCGWESVKINPPVPAGELEYNIIEMNAAVRAGENVRWERVGPNLCRIIRGKDQLRLAAHAQS